MTLDFRVYGVAQQMGSKSAHVVKGGRVIVTDQNRSLKSWQHLVAVAAREALLKMPEPERRVLDGPVGVRLAFHFPRPSSLPKKIRAHVKAPDLDKAVRGLCDALSAIVFVDDRQIVDLIAMKRYAPEGAIPWVDVRVEVSDGVEPLPYKLPLFAEADHATN